LGGNFKGITGAWSVFGDGMGSIEIRDGWRLIMNHRIQTWALEEARRRLEVEGILKEPESKP